MTPNAEYRHEAGASVERRRRSAFRRVRAFSLVELIVALGVTALISAIMITIVVNLLDTARRATGSLMSSNQAKVALDFLAQDLQSAVMRPDGNVWLVATVQPDQTTAPGDSGASMARWTATTGGTSKPGKGTPGDPNASLQLDPQRNGVSTYRLADYRFGMAGVWLRFFTVEPDSNDNDANRSVVRAVAYQIVRYEISDETGASLRYGLFRSWVRPYDGGGKSTFETGYDMFEPAYNVGGGSVGDPGPIRRPRRDLLLANNVIDFGVRFWVRLPDGSLQLRFPTGNANLGFAATSDLSEPRPPDFDPGGTMTYGFPVVAEIFLRVLSDEGAEVLEAYERNPFPGTTWWEVALANSQVYTRRIEIKGTVP